MQGREEEISKMMDLLSQKTKGFEEPKRQSTQDTYITQTVRGARFAHACRSFCAKNILARP